MRRFHLFFTLLLIACSGCQQTRPAHDATFEPAQLREDLTFLRDAVQERHPRFHAAPLDAELRARFERTNAAIRSPMTRTEAFRQFARINPAFRDAHTLLMPKLGDADDTTRPRPFPFRVRLDAAGALRLASGWRRDSDATTLAPGTRIVAINGVPSARLLDELAPYGHGETETLQRHMLTVMFPDWLASVRGWGDTFDLVVAQDAGDVSVHIARDDAWMPAASDASAWSPTLQMLDDGIAWLRIPSFDVDDAPEAYRADVDAAFARIRAANATGLIVDVRGNTGGQSDAGAHVIRYLIDVPVNQVSRARERLNADNRGLLGHKGRIGELREMDLSRDGLVEPAPEAERYDGPVVLLVDAMTYSAGILFATTLQDHGIARLVGQPTGGHGNQTGNMEAVHLPNTGLLAFIPAREFVRPSGDVRVRPVMPDVIVEVSDATTDATLTAAIEDLCSRNRTRGERCRAAVHSSR